MTERKVLKLKWVLLIVSTLFLASISLLYYRYHQPVRDTKTEPLIAAHLLVQPRPMRSFHFQSTDHASFTQHDLLGHWTLLFFGFTHSPYITPATLSQLSSLNILLEQTLAHDFWPKIVMISIDPARDHLPRLQSYLSQYQSGFIGVRGDIIKLRQFAQPMNVVFNKIPMMGKDQYLMTHSAQIIVINPNAQIVAFLSYPQRSEQMLIDYEILLQKATV